VRRPVASTSHFDRFRSERRQSGAALKFGALKLTIYPTPLQSKGLSRRIYPFLGIAIVGVATIHGIVPVIQSAVLALGMAIGIGLVLLPLVDLEWASRSRLLQAAPVIVGFVLAQYPLYSGGSLLGVISAMLVGACGSVPLLVSWERVPRYLHAIAPIGGLAIAFGIELAFDLPVVQSFPYVLMPIIFLALYYTTLELAIGSFLGIADLLGVALINPRTGQPGLALVASLILLAFGVLVRRVVLELERSRTAATLAEEKKSQLLADLEKRNRELEELMRLKSEFLTTLSHEIRTPLNGVLGMTSLLLDTDNRRDQREYAESIRSSSEALLGVLNNVVDFSTLEGGRVHLELSEFEPGRIINEAVAPFAEAAANKGIALVIELGTGLPGRVTGDAGRLRQILVNLIGNAVKFTDSGKVVIRTERSQTKSPGAGIRFEVEDTGIGMTRDEESRIFTVYSQLDSSTTRRHGGAGLGLATARMLVEMMGGELEVESEKGRGSRFWFTGLFRQADSASPHGDVPSSPAAGR
jgi:signal transduction histidine kinase